MADSLALKAGQLFACSEIEKTQAIKKALVASAFLDLENITAIIWPGEISRIRKLFLTTEATVELVNLASSIYDFLFTGIERVAL